MKKLFLSFFFFFLYFLYGSLRYLSLYNRDWQLVAPLIGYGCRVSVRMCSNVKCLAPVWVFSCWVLSFFLLFLSFLVLLWNS